MTRLFIHSKLGQNFPIRGSAGYCNFICPTQIQQYLLDIAYGDKEIYIILSLVFRTTFQDMTISVNPLLLLSNPLKLSFQLQLVMFTTEMRLVTFPPVTY